MGNNIQFTDNSMQVKNAISGAVTAFLYEAGGELQARARDVVRVDTGLTKGLYGYKVVEEAESGTVYVGNSDKNAIWEEFGTGEYALKGNGRKGGWYVPEEKLSAKAKSRMKKYVAKDGKVYYHTYGKKPTRPLYNAFQSLRGRLQYGLESILKERLGN